MINHPYPDPRPQKPYFPPPNEWGCGARGELSWRPEHEQVTFENALFHLNQRIAKYAGHRTRYFEHDKWTGIFRLPYVLVAELVYRLEVAEWELRGAQDDVRRLQQRQQDKVGSVVALMETARTREFTGKITQLEEKLRVKKELECIHGDDIHCDLAHWQKKQKDLKRMTFICGSLTVWSAMFFVLWLFK